MDICPGLSTQFYSFYFLIVEMSYTDTTYTDTNISDFFGDSSPSKWVVKKDDGCLGWKNCWLCQDVIDSMPFVDLKCRPRKRDQGGVIYSKINFRFRMLKGGIAALERGRDQQAIKATVKWVKDGKIVKEKDKPLKELSSIRLPDGSCLFEDTHEGSEDEPFRVYVVTPYEELFEHLLLHLIWEIFPPHNIRFCNQKEIFDFGTKSGKEVVENVVEIMYKVARYVNSLSSPREGSDEQLKKEIEAYSKELTHSPSSDKSKKSPIEHKASAIRKEFVSAKWALGELLDDLAERVNKLGYKFAWHTKRDSLTSVPPDPTFRRIKMKSRTPLHGTSLEMSSL